ncbi:glycosyltransferase family 4 protein [Sphingomonas sp. MA1305]|uniref:glycosyltransferase family 4 protein n=1 Tax=Sphingomonas sp. MA1305 TaxID=2479204 RepID=UPI0018DF3372|nr:glycosyltransferase family 4 protein [Sphingomonas sp. MA1305]
MGKKRPICFFGPLPPPVHGMAKANAEMIAALARERPIAILNISAAGLTRNARYHLVKLGRISGAYLRLLWARSRHARLLYASVDDGLGGWWTALTALIARLMGMRIYLHHHSFRYIVKRSHAHAVLAWCAGRDAVHIVLCPQMAARLTETYPLIGLSRIVPNSVDERPPAAGSSHRTGPLRIGMLANLTFAKGLDTFVELAEAAWAQDIAVEAVLAGPIPIAAEREATEAAVERSGGGLTWLGPVSGAEKEAFFAEIDLLILPTRYPTEAYPLVLLEALVRGVGTIAHERGCIGALTVHPEAIAIPVDADFIALALPLLMKMAAMPTSARAAKRKTIQTAAIALNATNAQARETLVRDLIALA